LERAAAAGLGRRPDCVAQADLRYREIPSFMLWRRGQQPPGKARRDPDETQRILAALYYDTALSANQTQFDALRTLAPTSNIPFGSDHP
jgi:hypothetical protein